ncbi:three-Cys-motif partner protein TcmP [Mitsuaria sp. GD03876]|uniref:three-Cys-motif partner protein TcmP n=1 Tax=Mitsuaria sp. GD03876 TaxID=2975399 RepID=UPI00244C2D1E|nr:three-Cys-motif partner protein TcmP [Mitsuaria sp. GD03876]MDH0864880.1 three-Cys-motif partner protein TcmP [Mitsuaria sp. GD03876]
MSKRPVFTLPVHADPCPQLIIERGPTGVGVGSWVPQFKHTYLAKYIDGTRKAQVKFPRRVLIDPFCGPGRIQVHGEAFTRDGGTMVAWRQSVQSRCPFTDILIGDLDDDRSRACEARLRAVQAPVTRFDGPATETAIRMAAAVPRGALCLAYIDPHNLEFLSFSIIERLALLPHVDFAVHFSLMDLSRNVDMELDPERDRFNGANPGWRDRCPKNASKASLAAWFFNDWRDRIARLGFSVSEEMPLVPNEQGRPLYRLVFFSRHALPERIWGDIARSPNLAFDF